MRWLVSILALWIVAAPTGATADITRSCSGQILGIATINLSLTGDWERWRSRLDPIWADEVATQAR